VAVYVHETHCRPEQLGRKGPLLSPWQRYTVGLVIRQAVVAFVSTAHYANQVIGDYGLSPDKVVRLPIASNIPCKPLNREQWIAVRTSLGWQPQERVAITFGSYATQLRALRSCGPCLVRGIDAGQLDRVICVGGGGFAERAHVEACLALFARPRNLEVRGYQTDQRMGEILAACDFAFSAYPRSRLGKSSAFAAFALAGLAVLVPDGPAEAEDSPALPVFPVKSWTWDPSNSTALQLARQAVQQYAFAHLAWPAIARRALTALQYSERSSPKSREPAVIVP
jgi:hypothetical protein